jgi:hypothetical protein
VIRVSALPVELTLNKLCIQQLMGFFMSPLSNTSPSAKPPEVMNLYMYMKTYACIFVYTHEFIFMIV